MSTKQEQDWKFDKKKASKALQELSCNINPFRDENVAELVRVITYCMDLEQALDKACEVIDDTTKDNATEFCPATQFDWLPSNCNEHTCENGTKECWKEWLKEDDE